MTEKQKIEQEVDKTLNSLDGIRRAIPGPFMFTRIKANLEIDEKSLWTTALKLLSRPSVAFAAIIIALFINIIIFFEFRSASSQPATEAEQIFASEYNLEDNTIYDSTIEP